jgi:hypothetical protein
MFGTITHKSRGAGFGSSAEGGISESVFAGMPTWAWGLGGAAGGKSGLFHLDDFSNFNDESYSLLATPAPLATEAGAALHVQSTGSTNVEEGFVLNSPILDVDATKSTLCAWEMRLKTVAGSLVANAGDIFVGIGEPASIDITDKVFADGDTIIDSSLIGFRAFPGDCATTGITLDAIVKKTDSTAEAVIKEAAHVLTASYVQLGMRFDGTSVQLFVNGKQVGDLSAAFDNDLYEIGAVVKNADASTDVQLVIDWIAVAQEK